jgi:hypothetical protein
MPDQYSDVRPCIARAAFPARRTTRGHRRSHIDFLATLSVVICPGISIVKEKFRDPKCNFLLRIG